MVCGCFVSVIHWKYMLFLKIFRWWALWLGDFIGYFFGISRKYSINRFLWHSQFKKNGPVIVYGCFISTVRWKYSLFLRFSSWRNTGLRHFVGYPCGTSRKKHQPFSINSLKRRYPSPVHSPLWCAIWTTYFASAPSACAAEADIGWARHRRPADEPWKGGRCGGHFPKKAPFKPITCRGDGLLSRGLPTSRKSLGEKGWGCGGREERAFWRKPSPPFPRISFP